MATWFAAISAPPLDKLRSKIFAENAYICPIRCPGSAANIDISHSSVDGTVSRSTNSNTSIHIAVAINISIHNDININIHNDIEIEKTILLLLICNTINNENR